MLGILQLGWEGVLGRVSGSKNVTTDDVAAEALELADSTLLMDKPIHVLFSPFHHDLSPSVIFIKNLPKLVTRKALFHLLKCYGNLISLNIATDASGYATARYDCVEAAQSAITALNGNLLSNNKRLYVSSFLMVPVYGSPQRAYNKLFLRIHDGISEKFIRETLSSFGAVINVCITESFPKGDLFADVTMEDSKAADRAAAALVPHRPGLLYLGRIQEDTSTFRPVMFLVQTLIFPIYLPTFTSMLTVE
ncbi:hypothetical protein AgCh_024099 [Apium graveolens]